MRKRLKRRGSVEVSRETIEGAVSVCTRPVLTIPPNSELWATGVLVKVDVWKDALVRLQPPHDATVEQIETAKHYLLHTMGVLKVKVSPRAAAPETLQVSNDERPEDAYKTPRMVINELVKKARVKDRPALRRVVNSCLAQAEDRKPIERVHGAINVGHIVGLRLLNWSCFRGEFELELDQTTYSITASQVDNEERSNWLGKSSLLRAIKFAVTGEHYAEDANGWITRGEAEGGVDIEFANGVFISRFRKRGSATELEVVHGDETMTGSAAQRYIDEAIIDSANLSKTGYLEQKQTDQFVKLKPKEFSEAVNTWLGIDWVAEAADLCVAELNELTKERAVYERQLVDGEALAVRSIELREELEKAEEQFNQLVERKKRYDLNKRKVEDYKRRKANADKAKAIRVQITMLERLGFDEEAYSKALQLKQQKHNARERAKEEVSRTMLLLHKGFDGECPVAGIQCPVKEQINSRVEENTKAHARAIDAQKLALYAYCEADMEAESRMKAKARYERRLGELKRLREQLKELESDERYAKSHKPPREEEDPTHEHDQALRKFHQLSAQLELLQQQEKESVEAKEQIRKLTPKVAVHQAACAILGRSGAQRLIAEGSLKAIERDTNNAMAKLDVDLRVQVLWDKEGKKLADACDDCGAPFPASQRVKQCDRCGAKRGPKVQQKPRLELSNRSGGADDGVGLVFQLSASNWNARRNGLGWPIFLIDEPFGALDRHNTRAIGGRLDWLLREHFGAEQAFVVAHHAEVLESTPGRIHITSDGTNSRVEVISG